MSYRAIKHLFGETSLERKLFYVFGSLILVLIAGRAPDERTRPAFAFMVLKSLDHIGLLERSVLV